MGLRQLIRMSEQFLTTSQKYYTVARFLKCIGAIEGTHVKNLGGNNAEIFKNRKGFFLVNGQVIYDAWFKTWYIVQLMIHNYNSIRARFEREDFQDYVLGCAMGA